MHEHKDHKSFKKYGKGKSGSEENSKFISYSIFAKADIYLGSIPQRKQ